MRRGRSVLVEGGRRYLGMYEVEVMIQGGGNWGGMSMYVNNNGMIG
ncbi:hypothetical protein [Bacillus thuringiensis]|nr:hypothetical protein [Bacillus thuringiensis]